MTLDEAKEKCKTLEKLNLDIWNAVNSSTKAGLRSMFCDCWKSITSSGYRILRCKELDPRLGYRVPQFKIREDKPEDVVEIIDNRGKGNHHGDCTTRCISFCTGVDYSTIQKEQFKYLAEEKAKYYYGHLTWRHKRVWEKCLLARGFCELVLPRHISGKVFLRKFKDSGIDDGIIAALSSRHVAAIDMKTNKILDCWNSAGCRIKSIFVPTSQKSMWIAKIDAILK